MRSNMSNWCQSAYCILAGTPLTQGWQVLWLQVSWCKLEVTISTPKHIQAECSSLQGRVPPQLVVAAIHVKTRLTAQVGADLCGGRHWAPVIHGRIPSAGMLTDCHRVAAVCPQQQLQLLMSPTPASRQHQVQDAWCLCRQTAMRL